MQTKTKTKTTTKTKTKTSSGVRRVGLAFHNDCLLHVGPKSHPESSTRVSSILEEIQKQGLYEQCMIITDNQIPLATKEQLLLTHDESHVTKIFTSDNQISTKPYIYLDPDTYYSKASPRAALLAVGAVIELMERVIKNELDSGFAVVRPPGHHCEKHTAMGFCLFSNVVVAINAIKHKYKNTNQYQRFAIIDWDVHHGNGTQNLFWKDPDVLYISTHRSDGGIFYPQTGFVTETGCAHNVVNMPLWKGMGDTEYQMCFEQVICPVIENFAPDMILISCGFDACIGDPLGGMNVTPPMYGQFIDYLYNRITWKSPNKPRIVALLEGGYHLQNMPKAAACLTYALLHQSFNEKQFLESIKDSKKFDEWKSYLGKNSWTDNENERRSNIEEMLTKLLAVHSLHFPKLKTSNLFTTLKIESDPEYISLLKTMDQLSLQVPNSDQEMNSYKGLLEYLLSLYPYGIEGSSIESLVQYRIDTLKDQNLLQHSSNISEWLKELNTLISSNDRLLSNKYHITNEGVILPLEPVVRVYKVNNGVPNEHINGSYVLYTPLLGRNPYAEKDLLQKCIDLKAYSGGTYVEFVNYHPLFPSNTKKSSSQPEYLILEGPIAVAKNTSKSTTNTQEPQLTWQINHISDINGEHQSLQHYKSYPFLFSHHIDSNPSDDEKKENNQIVKCLDAQLMPIDFKKGDNVYAYMEDDAMIDLQSYNEQDRAIVQQCIEKKLVISGRIIKTDITRKDGGKLLVELGECEEYKNFNDDKEVTHVGTIWLKSVHLNEVKFMKEYQQTLLDRPDIIKIYLKGFNYGIDYEENNIQVQVTNVLKVVDEILKDEMNKRHDKGKDWNTFSLLLIFDGDSFAHNSFTNLLPKLYTHVHTEFSSQVSNIQLLAFIKKEDRIRFERDWRDVLFKTNSDRQDNVKIWSVLTDYKEWYDLGVYGLTCTQTKHVLCFGGGNELKKEYLQLLKHKEKYSKSKILFHIFDIYRLKYSLQDQIEKENSILINWKNDDHKETDNHNGSNNSIEIKKYII